MFQFAFRPGTPPEFLCFSILTFCHAPLFRSIFSSCLVIPLLEVLISQSWWWHHDHFLRFQTCKNLVLVRVCARGIILFSALSFSKYYELSLSKRRGLGRHKRGSQTHHHIHFAYEAPGHDDTIIVHCMQAFHFYPSQGIEWNSDLVITVTFCPKGRRNLLGWTQMMKLQKTAMTGKSRSRLPKKR